MPLEDDIQTIPAITSGGAFGSAIVWNSML